MSIYPGFVYERWPETRRERYDSAIQREGKGKEGRKEGRKEGGRGGALIRAKDQSTAWHSSF